MTSVIDIWAISHSVSQLISTDVIWKQVQGHIDQNRPDIELCHMALSVIWHLKEFDATSMYL